MKNLLAILAIVLLVFAFAGFVFWRYFLLGSITLELEPSDALVTVNGKATPDRTIRQAAGTYTIQISSPGYRTATLTVKLSLGSTINKKVTLTALPKPEALQGAVATSSTNSTGAITDLKSTPDGKKLFFVSNQTMQMLDLTANPPVAIPITPQLTDLKSVDWSPDFSLAIITKTSGETGVYDFMRYDLLHQEYKPFGTDLTAHAWSPDGKTLYFRKTNSAEDSLIKTDRAGANQDRLADLKPLGVDSLSFTTGNSISLYLAGLDPKKATDLFLFDTFQRLAIKLTDTTNAYGPVMAPDQNHLAYLENGELTVMSSAGKDRKNLSLRPSLGNYVFIDATSLAVFQANKVSVVDIVSGKITDYEVYAPSAAITGLIAAPDGKTLYYGFGGNLYKLTFTS